MDRRLFDLINRALANPMFDAFFPFWTDFQKQPLFLGFLFLFVLTLVLRKKSKALVIIASASLGTWLVDLLNAELLKPFFKRQRPLNAILRTDFHGSYSFPSSHAVDMFCLAMVLGLFYPRWRSLFFALAALTGLSRVYCGVHYPGDVFAGAIVGISFGYLLFKLTEKLMKTKFMAFLCLTLLLLCQASFAYEDPTEGKPFFPWVWQDQLKPTIVKGFDKTGLMIAGAGAASALVVHQYDGKVYDFSEDGGNLLMSEHTASNFGKIGNGAASLLIVGAQLAFDTKNGVKTARALLLTSVSHVSISAIVRRDRPANKTDFLPFPSSFPSGHTSSAFAVAGSMAYSYGWKGGVPAYLAASAIGLSRIKQNRHWASDVIGGAFLGTFWARASFAADETDKEAFLILPMPIYDGAMVSAVREF